jgi:hypothetical protein
VLWAVTIAAILVTVGFLPSPAGALRPSPTPARGLPAAASPLVASSVTRPAAPAVTTPSNGLQCNGVYWNESLWGQYVPSWCYGHDEPTMSFVSLAPGSGADANFSFTLPADGAYTQGDLYATLWIGGVVYDSSSYDQQAFLEFQLYPAPPAVTGAGSGAQDCLPNGAFNPVYTAGSNQWFACAIVWQLTNCPTNCTESAAFAAPLDAQGTNAILPLRSNAQLFVNLSGAAQSLQPWQIHLTDATAHTSGTVLLQNGTKALPPYYTTAAPGHGLVWGADVPGAIAFSYEIGHALNPTIPQGGAYGACYPGDGVCDSYWPGRWVQSGQLQLALPVVGAPGSAGFPDEIGLSSSAGGESWINDTAAGSNCTGPSRSNSTNCIYPWYIYRAQNYSFTFDSANTTNDTHDYRNWYQFPPVASIHATYPAPWGAVNGLVWPSTAAVGFNPVGPSPHRLTVLANGSVRGQFMEGAYWLNVTAPGCTGFTTFLYLHTGEVYRPSVNLTCPGLYRVTFDEGTSLPAGTTWSATLNGSRLQGSGSTIVFAAPNGTAPYSVLSPVNGSAGIRYLPTPNNGTLQVVGTALVQSILYAPQYRLTGVASPAAAGVVVPASLWLNPGATAQLSATANPGWAFASWSGSGAGSYTGNAVIASVTMNGPVQETAVFAVLYTVTFAETGLPAGTGWSVELNGVYQNSSTSTIAFQVAPGLFFYNVSGPPGYQGGVQGGSGTVSGRNLTIPVQFQKSLLFGVTLAGWELIGVVIVAVAVALGIVVALRRRRTPPPPPVPPLPPPSWVAPPPPH